MTNGTDYLFCFRIDENNTKSIEYRNNKKNFIVVIPNTECSLYQHEAKLIPKLSYENKKRLMYKYPSNYDFEKKYFGKNTLYTRINMDVEILDKEKMLSELYVNSTQKYSINKFDQNFEAVGKALILLPDKSVYESFYEDGEWTEEEFVDYFESLSDVYEYFNE